MQRILIVDDEIDMLEMLQDLLSSAGFEAVAVDNGKSAMQEVTKTPIDLVLMDLKLKGEDGLTVARAVRQLSSAPIVILTGKGDETDRILGLELVADDFVMKPFNPRELLARVRALLRRMERVQAPVLAGIDGAECYTFSSWTVNLTSRELFDANMQSCALTPGEFALLEAFVKNPRRVLSRDALLAHTRSGDTEVFDRTIDVLITRLRKKIEPNSRQPSFIKTERGIGYLFAADVKHA
ncbi:response regulator transcription factor [Leeia sp. TBRC 13508]|uniref:Response regulator transcription factor n=1 Tax=Leeia speluncae TaxID=2884804 RepID=A0ABS8D2T2_9NEIS|nr:response regulator transcription factor [Leeia speluncae]MCB6182512.1 response regulator transcription factor [Leeia speluncae]